MPSTNHCLFQVWTPLRVGEALKNPGPSESKFNPDPDEVETAYETTGGGLVDLANQASTQDELPATFTKWAEAWEQAVHVA